VEEGGSGDKSYTSSALAKLIEKTFPENPKTMLAIAQSESGLDKDCLSNSDKTKDGYVYSIGLFQLNLTQHEIAGLDCPKAFKGKNNDAVVINKNLYDQCAEAAKDVNNNLTEARKVYESQGLAGWSAYLSGAYLAKI
jgi:hypothetical protein